MSGERFVMKEQNASCTFRTYKNLLKAARDKANNEDIDLKMIMNAGLIYILNKTKTDMEGILKRAEKEVKI